MAWVPTAFTIRVVRGLADLAGPSGGLAFPAESVLLAYAAVLLLAAIRPKAIMERLQRIAWPKPLATLSLLALGIATPLVWKAYLQRPDGRLHLRLLDVGGASAILIESPTGRFLLVNGGPSAIALGEELDRALPFSGRRLDWLLITSGEADSIWAMAELADRVDLEGLVLAAQADSPAHAALLENASSIGVPVLTAASGQRLDLGGGAMLEIVLREGGEPGLRLTFGRAHWWIGGDIPSSGGKASSPQLQVLAAGDRTRQAASTAAVIFLSTIAADLPLAASDTAGRVLRTDANGWLEAETDGEWMWVRVERIPRAP
jgi:competence protein ComEC